MVLSHSKLKRKRKEKVGSAVDPGVAVPQTPPLAVATIDPTGEGKKKKKNKKGEKNKRQKTLDAGNVDVDLNGAVEEKVEVSKEDRRKQKKELKEEKKKRKAAERAEGASQIPASSLEENGSHHVDNRTDEATGNGVDKAEQPVERDDTTATGSERPLSVREKKGKKKKGAKDRWGVKIADADHVEENTVNAVNSADPENPVEQVAMRETPSTSTPAAEELYDLKKVFVGGMPYYSTEDDIHDYFSECGVISELDCMTFPDTGNFRGIAFITFKTEDGAAKAVEYDGADMGGRFLKIEKCKLKPRATAKDPERGEVEKTPGSTSAYIGNLSWDVTEDAIKNFFKKSNSSTQIDSIRLAFDKDSGDFKGFGHVDFGDDDSLEAAVKLNQHSLLGRPMKIAYSVPPKKSLVDGGNRNGNESRSAGTCYNCGEGGHKAFLCPKKGVNSNDKFDSRKVAACYSCGEEGHKSFLCPKKKAS